jgi:hypothetical protein
LPFFASSAPAVRPAARRADHEDVDLGHRFAFLSTLFMLTVSIAPQ